MIMEMERYVQDEEQMLELGAELAARLDPDTTVYLQGNLGTGKTTLVRGILRALGHPGAVKSPTYTLVEPYQFGPLQVSHFDLYRLGDPGELDYIGIVDYFHSQSIRLIEWPERGLGVLPPADIVVTIATDGSGRHLILAALSVKGQQLIAGLGNKQIA